MIFYIQEDPPYSIRVINSGKKHRRTTQEQTFFDYAMGFKRTTFDFLYCNRFKLKPTKSGSRASIRSTWDSFDFNSA